jgi:hypothetical protein
MIQTLCHVYSLSDVKTTITTKQGQRRVTAIYHNHLQPPFDDRPTGDFIAARTLARSVHGCWCVSGFFVLVYVAHDNRFKIVSRLF